MPINAPYVGGFSPGANLFAVDGNFTQCDPCGPPEIYYPFRGDSVPGLRDIVLLNGSNVYARVGLGSGYNIQPFSANQKNLVIEQDFMVAEAFYSPMPLNTPYNAIWAVGWSGSYQTLSSAFLVEEGPLQHHGGGIVKLRRKFATLPQTRNEMESYAYTFPAISADGTNIRFGFTAIVFSRVQYDYFVYDDLNILSEPLFPSGHRLNATTGVNPDGLILPQMRYFQNAAGVTTNLFLAGDAQLSDSTPTVPSFSQWKDWQGATGNQDAEIIAEASALSPWMGNIYQRKTRFVVAQ